MTVNPLSEGWAKASNDLENAKEFLVALAHIDISENGVVQRCWCPWYFHREGSHSELCKNIRKLFKQTA